MEGNGNGAGSRHTHTTTCTAQGRRNNRFGKWVRDGNGEEAEQRCGVGSEVGSHAPPTKEVGHGRSNTVPRQFMEKISDTRTHLFCEAHHAQSGAAAHVGHSVASPHVG